MGNGIFNVVIGAGVTLVLQLIGGYEFIPSFIAGMLVIIANHLYDISRKLGDK